MKLPVIPESIVLPRQDEDGRYYISYSQHDKWRTSKREYIRCYFFGEQFFGNVYTAFGDKVGIALQKNDFSEFSVRESRLLKKVTRLDFFEKRVELDLGAFFVLCYIDTCDKDLLEIIDYKTGDLNKEAYYRDDFYTQLVIYAAACKQTTGRLPKSAHVELIEREGNPYKGTPLTVGKEIVKINQKITKERVKKATYDIIMSAINIHRYYKVYKIFKEIIV